MTELPHISSLRSQMWAARDLLLAHPLPPGG